MTNWLIQSNIQGLKDFMAFKKKSGIDDFLMEKVNFFINRYASEIKVSDGVVVWFPGQQAGICKIAEVSKPPVHCSQTSAIQEIIQQGREWLKQPEAVELSDTLFGDSGVDELLKGVELSVTKGNIEVKKRLLENLAKSKIHVVELQLKHDFEHQPLLKEALRDDPILGRLRVIEEPRQTIYRMSSEEWDRIQALASQSSLFSLVF